MPLPARSIARSFVVLLFTLSPVCDAGAQPAPATSSTQAPAPLVCPAVLRLESTNGTDYVFVAYATRATTATFAIRAYAPDSDVTANLPAVVISTPYAGVHDDTTAFRSLAIDLRKPAGKDLNAATVIATSEDRGACPPLYVTIPTVQTVRDRPNSPADIQLNDAISAEVGAGDRAVALVPDAPTEATCAVPFSDSKVKNLGFLDYPLSARLQGHTGSAQIRVRLDAGGNVIDVGTYKSTGDLDLDRAAMNSARNTTFTPRIFACRPIPGDYLFRADFTGRIGP